MMEEKARKLHEKARLAAIEAHGDPASPRGNAFLTGYVPG